MKLIIIIVLNLHDFAQATAYILVHTIMLIVLLTGAAVTFVGITIASNGKRIGRFVLNSVCIGISDWRRWGMG